jgi:hypothetical protein
MKRPRARLWSRRENGAVVAIDGAQAPGVGCRDAGGARGHRAGEHARPAPERASGEQDRDEVDRVGGGLRGECPGRPGAVILAEGHEGARPEGEPNTLGGTRGRLAHLDEKLELIEGALRDSRP